MPIRFRVQVPRRVGGGTRSRGFRCGRQWNDLRELIHRGRNDTQPRARAIADSTAFARVRVLLSTRCTGTRDVITSRNYRPVSSARDGVYVRVRACELHRRHRRRGRIVGNAVLVKTSRSVPRLVLHNRVKSTVNPTIFSKPSECVHTNQRPPNVIVRGDRSAVVPPSSLLFRVRLHRVTCVIKTVFIFGPPEGVSFVFGKRGNYVCDVVCGMLKK